MILLGVLLVLGVIALGVGAVVVALWFAFRYWGRPKGSFLRDLKVMAVIALLAIACAVPYALGWIH